MTSPCMQCGACCATFRVAFYWAEAGDASLGQVPVELTRKLDQHRVSMIGTDTPAPRCLALRGDIGKAVHCSIYPLRPSPCRAFEPYDADGKVNPRCNAARARWQLPPLAPAIMPESPPVDIRLPVPVVDGVALATGAVLAVAATVAGTTDLTSPAANTGVSDEGPVLH